MTSDIPLFKIYWDDHDLERVRSVIEKGTYWAIGPEIQEFEDRICRYLGIRHAVAVNSGTSALHIILAAHGIGRGDEVIVPSFTFIATANAPQFVDAIPIFAEIEDETYGLDPDDVARKITPRTRAIVPVHFGGVPCRIAELKEIARKHNLLLIEDAAEALGATVAGKHVGTWGGAAILSFCANKVISTGEGGMVITDSDEMCERLKLLRSHGRAETANYFSTTEQMDYITLGYNFRMPTMIAALGIAQLDKIDKIIRMRRDNAEYLTHRLSGIDSLETPRTPEGSSHVYQLYTIRLKNNGPLRDRLMKHLATKKIMAKVYFPPVHLTRFYRTKFGLKEGHLPRTEKIASEVLTLPMYPGLTHPEMDYIAQSVRDFLRGV